MDASVWVAKTGLTAQQRRMTVIANNLANVNTVAFKRDRAVFEDLLYQNLRQPGASADAQTIARFVDGSFLLVSLNHTKRNLPKESLKYLNELKY